MLAGKLVVSSMNPEHFWFLTRKYPHMCHPCQRPTGREGGKGRGGEGRGGGGAGRGGEGRGEGRERGGRNFTELERVVRGFLHPSERIRLTLNPKPEAQSPEP